MRFLNNMIFAEVEQRAHSQSSLRHLSGDLFRETVRTLAFYWLLANQPPLRQVMPCRMEKPT